MMNEIIVTKLELQGERPVKVRTVRGQEFAVTGKFTLRNGEMIVSHVTSQRKKDLGDAIAREHEAIDAKAMKAVYHDGKFFGFSTKYKMGADGGLVPDGDIN